MKLVHCQDYEEMSRDAAASVAAQLAAKPNLLLCAATGSSPSGLYRELVRRSQLDAGLCSRLRILKLDEWLGIPHGDPVTCEHYLRDRVLDPLSVAVDRYISFSSVTAHPTEECHRVRQTVHDQGGIDICILGLGMNGHIGFNEPAESLEPWCHVARLSAATLRHSMLDGISSKPTHGMTLGVGDILGARKVVLLICGEGKEPIIDRLLSGQVTTQLPASLVLLHPNLEVFIDEGRAR